MKLASLQHGRDGKLVVVSSDHCRYRSAEPVAPTLQAALDNWSICKPALQEMFDDLNECSDGEHFDEQRCAAPLPRAYQWLDASAYVNHVELVRRARGAEMPPRLWSEPLMYQGGSDAFLGPRQAIPLSDSSWGLDFEAEIAIITNDVPAGVSPREAARHILLITLVNDISLRNLIPAELEKGFGFLQSKPPSAFAPIVVTPDELGDAWRDSKVHLPVFSFVNGELFGRPNAGIDMVFDFSELIAHAAKTRPLGAGTIIGSGTVSNTLDGGPGNTVAAGGAGYSCIAEVRMIELMKYGEPKTAFLKAGDRVRIEMRDDEGRSICGSIDQAII